MVERVTLAGTESEGIDINADRPAAGAEQQAADDGSEPVEPEVTASARAEPALAQHTIEPTRTSMVWTMVAAGVVLLVAILVFIRSWFGG